MYMRSSLLVTLMLAALSPAVAQADVVFHNDFSSSSAGFTPATGQWRRTNYGETGTQLYEGTGLAGGSLPVMSTTWLSSLPPGTTLKTAVFFGSVITWLKAIVFLESYLVFDVVDWNDYKWVRLRNSSGTLTCSIGEYVNGVERVRKSRTCNTTYTSNRPVPIAVTITGNSIVFDINNGADHMYWTYATAIDRLRVGLAAESRGAFDYFTVEVPPQ
jgi:hypothetical protein